MKQGSGRGEVEYGGGLVDVTAKRGFYALPLTEVDRAVHGCDRLSLTADVAEIRYCASVMHLPAFDHRFL